jgi:hypothetical protein
MINLRRLFIPPPWVGDHYARLRQWQQTGQRLHFKATRSPYRPIVLKNSKFRRQRFSLDAAPIENAMLHSLL